MTEMSSKVVKQNNIKSVDDKNGYIHTLVYIMAQCRDVQKNAVALSLQGHKFRAVRVKESR